MFPISPAMWVAAGAGVLILVLGAGVKIQTGRLDACKAEFETFKTEVRVIGEQAAAEAKAQEEKDKQRLKRANDENAKAKRDLAGMYAAYDSLRSQRTSQSALPAAAPGAADPDRACFSRSAIDKGMADIDRQLLDGAESIIRKGDGAIVDLNTARKWATDTGRAEPAQ